MKDGEIRPLPSNEFYQSPFDGRWVEIDEKEIGRLMDMQRNGTQTVDTENSKSKETT